MADMAEEWRSVPGFDATYRVSDLGRFQSCRTIKGYPRGSSGPGPIWFDLVGKVTATGYVQLLMRAPDGSRRWPRAHQLVAAAFIGPLPEGHQVNHRNGRKTDNRAINLEYVTGSENIRHAVRAGLKPIGERHHRAKVTDAQAEEIRRRYVKGRRGLVSALATEFGITPGQVHAIGTKRQRAIEVRKP